MRVIALTTLRCFWEEHSDSRQSLQAWYQDVRHSDWRSPTDIKHVYRTASILSNNRVVFNIKCKQYRLVVAINYQAGIVFIRFVGTHKEYDAIDATQI